MRCFVGDGVLMNGGEDIDVEKDLDAEEDSRLGIGESMGTVLEEGEDGNDL